MFAITLRAIRCIARRLPLYAVATVLAVAVQAAVVLLWRAPSAVTMATAIVPAILTTIVYAFVDAGEKRDRGIDIRDSAIWSRVLERSWAVIVIDFIIGMIVIEALAFGDLSSPIELVGAVLLLLLSAAFIFADASATVDDGDGMLLLIPHSFGRSLIFALGRRNLYRALVLLTLQIVLLFAAQVLYVKLTAMHVPTPGLWAFIPVPTVVGVPLSALTVLIYRDTGIEAK